MVTATALYAFYTSRLAELLARVGGDGLRPAALVEGGGRVAVLAQKAERLW